MTLFIMGSGAANASLSLWRLETDGSLQFVKYLAEENKIKATWIQKSPKDSFLYCVEEDKERISSFRVIKDRSHHVSNLEYINTVLSGGSCPCHLNELPNGSGLFVANYWSGTLSLLPVDADGSLGELLFTLDHNHNRLGAEGTVAHVHQVVVSPFNKDIIYVCDLGTDTIYTYSLSTVGNNRWLELIGQQLLPTGSGPRHLVINSNGTHAYIVSELKNTVCSVPIDPISYIIAASGEDSAIFQHSTIDTTVQSNVTHMSASEICISADDRFLYISNRDIATDSEIPERSSITVFSISHDGSDLHLIQQIPSLGRHPRHMCFTHNGTRLLVANRLTHNVAVFTVDVFSGLIYEPSVLVSSTEEHCKEPSFILEV